MECPAIVAQLTNAENVGTVIQNACSNSTPKPLGPNKNALISINLAISSIEAYRLCPLNPWMTLFGNVILTNDMDTRTSVNNDFALYWSRAHPRRRATNINTHYRNIRIISMRGSSGSSTILRSGQPAYLSRRR